MIWAEPRWLWALCAIPVLALFVERLARQRRRGLEKFVGPAVWDRVAPELDWKASLRKARVLLLAAAFAILALARPQWGSHEESVKVSGMDVLVALDVSSSMETEDVVPNRLKKARHLLKTLLERLEGDRVGLVAFAASAYTACPLTTDLDYVRETLDTLNPRSVLNQGTDFSVALETAFRALDRGAEEQPEKGDREASGAPSKVILLVSDGEDQEAGAEELARKVRASGMRLYAFGVGTPSGGTIPVRDDQGQLHGTKRDRRGEAVVSRFDARALEALARQGGGKFWRVSESEGEVEELLKDLGALNRSDFAERRYRVREDRFQFPLAVAVLLVFLELGIPARRLIGLLLGLGLLAAPQARAAQAPAEGKSPGVSAYLENEAGLRAFSAGRIDEAKRLFGSAQARAPQSPELRFNQGAVQFKDGETDEALRDFEGAAQAADRRGDVRLGARSWFNLGAVRTKKGDVPGAASSYVQAIERARRAGDAELERDARKNLELLVKNPESQSGQQQDSKDSKDPKEGQDSKGGKQGQQDKKDQQPKSYQDPSHGKRKFESKKLSPEDANRVMDELAGKEKELQERIRRQKGNPAGREKDW